MFPFFSVPRMVLAIGMAASAAGLLAPASAYAGRRPYFWVWDTEVMPERGVEWESWYTERISSKPLDQTQVWTAPVVGLTDRLELALPVEWSWWQGSQKTIFDWYGAELRYRIGDPDPDVAGPLTGLVRLAVHRPIRSRSELRLEANLVASYQPSAQCKFTLDAGAVAVTSGSESLLSYAGGGSCKTVGELRVGAEFFGKVPLHSAVGAQPMTMAGPNFSFTHGRFWLTGGALIGVTDSAPVAMPRLIWAISF